MNPSQLWSSVSFKLLCTSFNHLLDSQLHNINQISKYLPLLQLCSYFLTRCKFFFLFQKQLVKGSSSNYDPPIKWPQYDRSLFIIIIEMQYLCLAQKIAMRANCQDFDICKNFALQVAQESTWHDVMSRWDRTMYLKQGRRR